ncbi:MAG: DUF5115 domain-containing protein [Prevotella sp.]|nr:DUF5115 domain-containing protein [Prevotella sp.]
MKKHIVLGGMLLCAAAFTSCNEDFDDWASPQSNVPGGSAAAYGITVTAGSDANVVMDNAAETVEIVKVAKNQDEISYITLKSVTVNGASLPYTYENGSIKVKSAQLDSLVEATTFDRSATSHEVTIATEWSAVLTSGESVSASAETAATLTPYSSVPAIDSKGYAMLGQWQGWDYSNPTWMTEVEPGVYQATVITSDEGDNWYKFYKGSGFDEANFPWDAVALGCAENGDASSPNLLVWADDPRYGGFQTPVISGAGEFLVTLDMNKLYFKYEPKETRYYIVGNPQGWSTTDKTCLFYALGGNKFTYTTKWTNQWDLKIWAQDHFGDWNAAWGGENGSTAASGSLVFGGDADGCGAIGPNAEGGWYTFTFNMASKTYEWTAIDEPTTEYDAITVIGGFNGWSNEGEIELSQLEKAPHNWYARATIDADTELKFRANHDWAVNWGGDGSAEISEDKYYVPAGGDNIKVPAGTYDFYLNDITGLWCIALVVE